MRVANCRTLFITLSLFFLCVYSVEFNRFEYGARIVPHPKKVHKGGEDAFFAHSRVLAVADGVSFWNKKNIDPSKYSKELCRLVGVLVKEGNRTLINKPKEMIKQVVNNNTNPGTSTLVIASLDRVKPLLRTAYVGDSTYVIYRKQNGVWTLIFESEGQQHSFNYPFQLGYKSATHPNKAAEFVHEVQDKDIVVVASDGIFDNMTSEQVLAELLKFIGEDDELKNPKEAAHNLTETAFKLSLDRKYNSPFAQKSATEGKNFKGGKSDDITAVVGQIRLANVINITKTVVKEEPKEETAEPLQISEIIKRLGFIALIGVILTLVMVKKSQDLRKKTTAEKKR